jgi:Putative MetA-pathway of phenol degradation
MRPMQAARQFRRGAWVPSVLALAALVLLAAAPAQAQEIEPNDLIPLPAGSNVLLGYYDYGNETQFTFANGTTFTDNTGLQVNLGAGRYLHYFDLGGHPAAIQILQIFGSESGGTINGQSLGSAFGAADIALNAAIWPYANRAEGQYLAIVGWLYPPSGTYDPHSPLNLGDNRWKGDLQLAWDQRIGHAFTYDLSLDAMFYGDNDNAFPGGLQLSQDPTYRMQAWANWRWTRQFQTSIGYEGLFGGKQSLNGVFNEQETEQQRLRVAASYFITPRLQGLLEVNHDVQVVGGFKQQFGLILRIASVF